MTLKAVDAQQERGCTDEGGHSTRQCGTMSEVAAYGERWRARHHGHAQAGLYCSSRNSAYRLYAGDLLLVSNSQI